MKHNCCLWAEPSEDGAAGPLSTRESVFKTKHKNMNKFPIGPLASSMA